MQLNELTNILTAVPSMFHGIGNKDIKLENINSGILTGQDGSKDYLTVNMSFEQKSFQTRVRLDIDTTKKDEPQ